MKKIGYDELGRAFEVNDALVAEHKEGNQGYSTETLSDLAVDFEELALFGTDYAEARKESIKEQPVESGALVFSIGAITALRARKMCVD